MTQPRSGCRATPITRAHCAAKAWRHAPDTLVHQRTEAGVPVLPQVPLAVPGERTTPTSSAACQHRLLVQSVVLHPTVLLSTAGAAEVLHVYLLRSKKWHCDLRVARGAQSTRLVQNGLRLMTDRSPLMRTVGLPGLAGA